LKPLEKRHCEKERNMHQHGNGNSGNGDGSIHGKGGHMSTHEIPLPGIFGDSLYGGGGFGGDPFEELFGGYPLSGGGPGIMGRMRVTMVALNPFAPDVNIIRRLLDQGMPVLEMFAPRENGEAPQDDSADEAFNGILDALEMTKAHVIAACLAHQYTRSFGKEIDQRAEQFRTQFAKEVDGLEDKLGKILVLERKESLGRLSDEEAKLLDKLHREIADAKESLGLKSRKAGLELEEHVLGYNRARRDAIAQMGKLTEQLAALTAQLNAGFNAPEAPGEKNAADHVLLPGESLAALELQSAGAIADGSTGDSGE
jgi:hypothetical protein